MDSRINLSYHKRLFALLLSFIWIIVLCFMTFQYVREKDVKSDMINTQLQLCNNNIIRAIEEGYSYITGISACYFPFDDIRVTIIGTDGEVVYDNMYDANTMDNHLSRPEVRSASATGTGYHIRRQSSSDGKQYFYSATKGRGIIVRCAVPYSSSLKDVLKADWTFLWVLIVISIFVSLAGYFSSLRLGKTIERLNQYREQENALKEEKEKSRIKRQLTNNINHELKTPVASIQVCLETLLSGISLTEEKRQELIERCYTHNERLRHLLDDVSLITRLEDGSNSIERELVVINELLDEIKEEFTCIPEEDRMHLVIDFNEKVVINGNLSLLGSIFRNLTINSMSYSEGRTIHIALVENNLKYCRIIFEDDGVGVDEKNLTRLFERFYRVDKGRSRSNGGTGLGLAIVKHAVMFHGGSITASNRQDGGLRFEFTLQK
ncbi:MAG: sensor histidine kinase [Bacteroidales bacterium]|nr:sensor histidine kinase [Bacteroidales bacterium]